MTISKIQAAIPDWLPDWTKPHQYPDPKTTSLRQWAWEFLRRNPEYQQLWEKFDALPPGPIYEGRSAYAYMDIRERFEKEFGILDPAAPPMTIADPDFKWRLRFTNPPRYWILPIDWLEDDEFEMPEIDLEHSAEVVLKFDVRLPLPRQINSAKMILETQAKRLAKAGLLGGERAQIKKYQNYLRILDAKLSGATSKAIATDILGIKNDNPDYRGRVRETFKAAKQLRDRDYRLLSALA